MTTSNITFTITNDSNTVDICGTADIHSLLEIPKLKDFGFTRYLYVIDDVKSSLVLALLEKQRDEALFWAYELYFSGLKDDVFCMLEQLVTMIYAPLNPYLPIFLQRKKQEWEKTKQYFILGTFIYNMVYRPYDISPFVKTFCKDMELIQYINNNCISKPISTNKIYINIEQKDVVKYLTINNALPRTLLKKVIKYPIRKNTLTIFDHEHGVLNHAQLQEKYWYHWIYYSGLSPIWKERIENHNGTINPISEMVDFKTDDDMEEFYKKYNYEPDEQSTHIQEMNIGTGNEEQLDWREFYKLYSIK
jgi:hypothetical protein